MKTLIVGAGGQLGQELLLHRPSGVDCVGLSRSQLDIGDRAAVLEQVLAQDCELIINAAAYTAVDGAETKPDQAVVINGEGAGNLAYAAAQSGARLIHLSTDFVFDGTAIEPYTPHQEPRPLGVYGHSKLAGERRVQELLPLQSLVVRTAWVYSSYGSNFVKTMLRLMAERSELSVVNDQRGTPTWAGGLATALWGFAEHPDCHGIYHWTDGGSCTWYEFACEIYRQGLELGLLHNEVAIMPVTTEDYPTAAARPPYSVLDCSGSYKRLGIEPVDWRQQLGRMLELITS